MRIKRLVGALWLVMAVSACPIPAFATATNQISTVSPASASQATKGLAVTFTLSSSPPFPPPANIQPTSILLGTNIATSFSRPETNGITNVLVASFNIPNREPIGAKNVLVRYQGTNVVSFKSSGFSITPATGIVADFTATPASGVPPLTVTFSDGSTLNATNWLWDFGDGSSSTSSNPVHTYYSSGSYNVGLTVWGAPGSNTRTRTRFITTSLPPTNGAYAVVDTAQTKCYDKTTAISAPGSGQPFYGQDAQISGDQPAYTNNGDGTVTDLNTGLMWVQDRGELPVAWAFAVSNAANCRAGGYTDWRMPTIKELYSLAEFSGANGMGFTSTTGYVPFIDTNYFGFAYGPGTSDTVGSRVIDAQDWSANACASPVMSGQTASFGFNFTDGRIKGYPQFNSNYVRYVRGNPSYGVNNFINNGDGTVSDKATLLMWARNDSGFGMDWSNALAWVQAQNAGSYLGYSDWRLPNAKELQTIVDYTRSPDTTRSAAIDPVFNCSGITNEAYQADFPWCWTGTTLMTNPQNAQGVYVCFGRAMAYTGTGWVDAHGAGAQRSDPKEGNLLSTYTHVGNGYYSPLAPQGDAIRIFNYVRLVRDIPVTRAWRFAFVGDTHVPLTTVPTEIAASAANDDARFLVIAGDVTESGAACSPTTFATQLTTWRNAMAPLLSRAIPVYVIRGNHEDDVPNGLAEWTNFFSAAYSMPLNGPPGEQDLTYSTSVTYANALLVGLDEYVNIHQVNQAWLDQQLASNRLPHLFVFGHEPGFKAFHTDCLGSAPAQRNTFWNSLSSAGARVYLCGHDHFLNVARIDDGDGNRSNDLYQLIVGTGGSTNWPPQPYNYNGTNAPYLPVNLWSVTETYGYLLVEISGTGVNDLGVTMTWKQRSYDTNTSSYIYVPTTNVLTYTAVNRYQDSVGDGVPDWWRARYFGGNGTATNAPSCATADPDHDGIDNYHEYLAGTNPTDAPSYFHIQSISNSSAGLALYFQSAWGRAYTLYSATNLTSGQWSAVPWQSNLLGDGGLDVLADTNAPANGLRFYRIGVSLP